MSVPPPPTSLLSLPNELLIKIARDVAPNRGRKAGNLRLVCRHLGRVVAPVTWASIVLPVNAQSLDELVDELLNNRTGNTSYIVSIRYNRPGTQLRVVVSGLKALPALRRLHLAGADEDGLFVPEHDLLRACPCIETLQLDLIRCGRPEYPFGDPDSALKTVKVKYLQLIISERELSRNITDRALVALSSSRTEPFSLSLTGATKLFKISTPTDPAAPLIVRILNWIAHGPLTTLCLPVFGAFYANDVHASLSLLHIQTLVLDVDPTSLATLHGDLLSAGDTSNYIQLIRFLKLAALPSLATLHLRGWIDTTGASKVGNTPIRDLPDESLTVYGLLGFLRKTTITELRLENSVGHTESDVQCIFTREGEGDWTSRLARFW
ncbi:hypothetical protein RQP46_001593 [Phenoliferia psychrophenolica]